MISHMFPWLMGPVLVSAVLAGMENSGNGVSDYDMLKHVPRDDFLLMESFPIFPTMFAPASEAVSNPLCRNDSLLFLNSLNNATLWAMEMFDSSAKFPTGLFVGVNHNLGNYGECLSVKATFPDNNSPDRSFIGKYCLANLEIPLSKLPNTTNAVWAKVKHSVNTLSEPSMNFLKWAICIPSSCSGDDLKSHLKYILPQLDQLKAVGIPVDHVEVAVNDNMCSTMEDHAGYTTGQRAVLIVMLAVLVLICLGSLVDIISEKVKVVPEGYFTQALQCFSFPRNLKKLFTGYQPSAALRPISGVKFFSMTLIIFGHRVLLVTTAASDNPRFLSEKYDDVELTVLLSGNLLVDTFFFITGFLLSYHCILESAKLKSVWNILCIYFHRYLRLTPVYMFIVAFYATLFIKLGSGPEWNASFSSERDSCLENWWINALYLNNMYRAERMCFRISWYLAVDMQLFIISVPVVYLLVKKAKLGQFILWILLVSSLIIPFTVIYFRHLEPIVLNFSKNGKDLGAYDTFNSVYIPTYMRATPYFMGVLCGYYVHYFNNNNMKLSQLQANCMTIGAYILGFLPILTSTVFYQQNYEYNALPAAAYSSLQRLSWAMAIYLGIVVFNAGKEWSIMKFLSWKMFMPLGKLTYSAYLLHILPQYYDMFSFKTIGHISWLKMIHLTFSDIVVAYSLSFIVSMGIEAPWMNVEKLLLRKYGPASAHEKSENTEPSGHKCMLMRDIEKPV